MSKDDNFDFLYKIIVLGDAGVGKSCLLSRFVRNEFNISSKATIGVEFFTKIMPIGQRKVKAQLWDTAGQEKFHAVTSAYYRGAVGCILVYDVTDWQSYKNLNDWITQFKDEATPDVISMIIGNKTDLKDLRAVSISDGQELADLNDMLFMEASALNASNVEDAFELMIRRVYQRQTRRRKQSTLAKPYVPAETARIELEKVILGEEVEKKSSCC